MPELIDLAPGILVHTSEKEATTSVVLASTSEALLIDPAWSPEDLADIAEQLAERGLTPIAGLATHAHHDHLLWHPGFGNTPRYASSYTVKIAHAELAGLLEALGPVPPEIENLFGMVQPLPHAPASEMNAWLPAGTTPEGHRVELIVHNGHIAGHTAVWLPASRVLIAGDMLSDVELPLPDIETGARVQDILGIRPLNPVTAYLEALDALEPVAREARVVIPGHGSVGADPLERLEHDRAYLTALLAGEDPADPRIDNPGMRQWHERLAAWIAES